MENTAQIQENEIEPRKKRGFWGWCAVIIRSLFILLFAVILLGGLYFKAPWKVLVLDALLLALLTVVPKKKRKYGWLALAAAVLAVTVWIFIPEKDTGDWRPYTFDEQVAALNAKYGVPDDENAALYYEQIQLTDFYKDWSIEDMNTKDAGPDKWDPDDETLSRPWKAEEFPELATWLETEKEKIAPFWKAVKCEKCWFEETTRSNTPDSVRPKRCSKQRKTMRTVQRIIYNDLTNQQIENTIDKSLGLLQLSKHIQQQYTFMENLVGIAIYANATPLICDIVINYPVDSESLKQFEKELKASLLDWDTIIDATIEHEKVLSINGTGNLFEINDKGKIRIAKKIIDPSIENDMMPEVKFDKNKGVSIKQPSIPSEYWQERQWKYDQVCGWLGHTVTPEKISAIIDELYIEFRKKIQGIDNYQEPQDLKFLMNYDLSFKSIYRLIGFDMQLPAIKTIKETHDKVKIKQKGALIIITLKQFYNEHEVWPGSLEEITERSVSNSEQLEGFMFQKVDDNFILYHIGPNGKDEKGFHENTSYHFNEETSRWEKSETADDILIWPLSEDELKQMMGIEEPEEPEIDGDNGDVFLIQCPGCNGVLRREKYSYVEFDFGHALGYGGWC